jgi:hypothetical protein
MRGSRKFNRPNKKSKRKRNYGKENGKKTCDCYKNENLSSWRSLEEYVRDQWSSAGGHEIKRRDLCISKVQGTPSSYHEIENYFLKRNIQTKITDCGQRMKITFVSNGREARDYLAKQNDEQKRLQDEKNRRLEIEEEKERKKQKERIERFGEREHQLYRTKLNPSKTFPTLIHCREYILKNSLTDIETVSLQQRMSLTSEYIETHVDYSIEVRLLATKTEPEEWVSFNDNWKYLYPFNKIRKQKHIPCQNRFECKGYCTDIKGPRVYVLQLKGENTVYSGGTNKCLYWRYYQHSEGEKSNIKNKMMYPHEPKKGLRWDLIHKFYNDEHIYECSFESIEEWIHRNLKDCGYDDSGDGGKHISLGLS